MSYTLESLDHFWIKVIVRVRDNSNSHSLSAGNHLTQSFPGSQAFASSVAPSPSGSSAAACSGSFSRADSAASLSFIAPTNRPVNNPPLKSVLRKNSQVCGQPAVPVVSALHQPIKFLVYSGL